MNSSRNFRLIPNQSVVEKSLNGKPHTLFYDGHEFRYKKKQNQKNGKSFHVLYCVKNRDKSIKCTVFVKKEIGTENYFIQQSKKHNHLMMYQKQNFLSPPQDIRIQRNHDIKIERIIPEVVFPEAPIKIIIRIPPVMLLQNETLTVLNSQVSFKSEGITETIHIEGMNTNRYFQDGRLELFVSFSEDSFLFDHIVSLELCLLSACSNTQYYLKKDNALCVRSRPVSTQISVGSKRKRGSFQSNIYAVVPNKGMVDGGEMVDIFLSINQFDHFISLLRPPNNVNVFFGNIHAAFRSIQKTEDCEEAVKIIQKKHENVRDLLDRSELVVQVFSPKIRDPCIVDVLVTLPSNRILRKSKGYEYVSSNISAKLSRSKNFQEELEEDDYLLDGDLDLDSVSLNTITDGMGNFLLDDINNEEMYDFDNTDIFGRNSLFYAVARDNFVIVKMKVKELERNGKMKDDLRRKDLFGYDIFDVAKFFGRERIEEFLESTSASTEKISENFTAEKENFVKKEVIKEMSYIKDVVIDMDEIDPIINLKKKKRIEFCKNCKFRQKLNKISDYSTVGLTVAVLFAIALFHLIADKSSDFFGMFHLMIIFATVGGVFLFFMPWRWKILVPVTVGMMFMTSIMMLF